LREKEGPYLGWGKGIDRDLYDRRIEAHSPAILFLQEEREKEARPQ